MSGTADSYVFNPSRESSLQEISKIISEISTDVFNFAMISGAGGFKFINLYPVGSMSDSAPSSQFSLTILKDNNASLATLAASVYLREFISCQLERNLPIRITGSRGLYDLEVDLSISEMAEKLLKDQLRFTGIPTGSVAIKPDGWSKASYIISALNKQIQNVSAADKDQPIRLEMTLSASGISVLPRPGGILGWFDMDIIQWALERIPGLSLSARRRAGGAILENLLIEGSPESILKALQDYKRSLTVAAPSLTA